VFGNFFKKEREFEFINIAGFSVRVESVKKVTKIVFALWSRDNQEAFDAVHRIFGDGSVFELSLSRPLGLDFFTEDDGFQVKGDSISAIAHNLRIKHLGERLRDVEDKFITDKFPALFCEYEFEHCKNTIGGGGEILDKVELMLSNLRVDFVGYSPVCSGVLNKDFDYEKTCKSVFIPTKRLIQAKLGRQGFKQESSIFIDQYGGLDSFDLYHPGSNMNMMQYSSGGSGGYALACEFLTRQLSLDSQLTIVDCGRGYEGLVRRLGGEFHEVMPTGFSLNPMELISAECQLDSVQGAIYFREFVSMLVSTYLGDSSFVKDIVKKSVYIAVGNKELTLGAVLKYMSNDSVDVRHALSPFIDGHFKHWFSGTPTVDFSNKLNAFELEGLKCEPLIMGVATASISLIANLQARKKSREQQQNGESVCRQMLFIEEGWDVVSENHSTFYEFIWRIVRKHNMSMYVKTMSPVDIIRNSSLAAMYRNSRFSIYGRGSQDCKAFFRNHTSSEYANYWYERCSVDRVNSLIGFMLCDGAEYRYLRAVSDDFTETLFGFNPRHIRKSPEVGKGGWSESEYYCAVNVLKEEKSK